MFQFWRFILIRVFLIPDEVCGNHRKSRLVSEIDVSRSGFGVILVLLCFPVRPSKATVVGYVRRRIKHAWTRGSVVCFVTGVSNLYSSVHLWLSTDNVVYSVWTQRRHLPSAATLEKCTFCFLQYNTGTKLEKHSIEVHNSRQPLDRLTLTLTLTFDLIFIGGRGIVCKVWRF